MTQKSLKTPKIAGWLLRKFAFTFEETALFGDIEEEFRKKADEGSPFRATSWY